MVRTAYLFPVLVLAASCATVQRSEVPAGGAVGVDVAPEAGAPSVEGRVFVSPSGRAIVAGTVDELGFVHVVWYDRRNDDVDLDLYYSFSTDGGATFRTNRRLTAASFVPILPSEGAAAAFIGDYNGIAAGPAGAFPFYQDSRRSEQDVWVTRLPAPLLDGFESENLAAWSSSAP